MKSLIAVVALALVGCGSLPSMQYCHTVKYERKGIDIHIEADCRAAMTNTVLGL